MAHPGHRDNGQPCFVLTVQMFALFSICLTPSSPNIPSARYGSPPPPFPRSLPTRPNVRPSLNTLRSTFPPNIPSSARHDPPHSRILPLSLIRPNVQFALNAPCTLSLCLLFLLLPQSIQMFAPLTKKQTPGLCRTPVLSVSSPLHRGSAAPPIPAASAAYSQKRPNGR